MCDISTSTGPDSAAGLTTSQLLSLGSPTELSDAYQRKGTWRASGFISDLRHWRDTTPDAFAISAFRSGCATRHLTYRQYAEQVERFAGALYELGVRPGQVVAVQLPNWWQFNVLVLACSRLGAVLAPITTAIRPRELERILRRLNATVCVTVDKWDDFEHSKALASMASRLPALRHRVVLGERIAENEVDFAMHFRQPWEQRHPVALDDAVEDPDAVAFVMFTSGTSGEPKGILHSANTVYAALTVNLGSAGASSEEAWGTGDVFFTPHAVAHITGVCACVAAPLVVGGRSVVLDIWDPATAVDVMAETRTTFMVGAPVFVSALATAAGERSERLPALRWVRCGATAVPERIVAEISEAFGLAVQAAWGMTEIPLGTLTRLSDPSDWAAHSDGRPVPGLEIDLRMDGEATRENPARLFVRGAGVCVATLGRDTDELRVIAAHDDGWYDTGDLVVPDGRGGIRVCGRTSDRIGPLGMIPVSDVESALRAHPAIIDVALVGYPGDGGVELACAVAVVSTASVTLTDLRGYLAGLGMTDWHRPSRLEIVDTLPRNAAGKVRKELLRRWLRGEAAINAQ